MRAADAMLKHETGVLAATTAFGKTVVAAWLIALRGVNTLVLVHRRQLLDQWVERLAEFLDLPVKSIGRIGGGLVLPLLATQILWINLVTDGLPALALGVDPADEELMQQPPRSIGEGVLSHGCGAASNPWVWLWRSARCSCSTRHCRVASSKVQVSCATRKRWPLRR
jgi:hypothetical protein